MSPLLIQQYLNQLAVLKKVSGTTRESVVQEAFTDLLKGMGWSHDLTLVPEYAIESKTRERRYVDGALTYELRVPVDNHPRLLARLPTWQRASCTPADCIMTTAESSRW